MKNLKKIILEELTILTEKEYNAPLEILDTLKDKLKMNPLIRYVDSLKAVNSIPPSYEVRLLNGQTFDIYYEDFSLLIKIGAKEYYVMDMSERSEAIEHINRLLTLKPIPPFSAPEEEDTGETAGGATGGGATGGTPTPPAATGGGGDDVAMEPDEDEPEDEPEEEPEA